MTQEELDAMNAESNMTVDRFTLKKVEKYNKWVKDYHKKQAIFRPKPPRENTKEPFKYSDVYLVESKEQIEKYPIIKERVARAIKEGMEE
jgi:hypothetical protein